MESSQQYREWLHQNVDRKLLNQWRDNHPHVSLDLCKVDLSHAGLYDINLQGVNLREANLNEANLENADLRGANLRGANLRGAKLSGAQLADANLSGADLSGADFSKANLNKTELQLTILSKTNLTEANLSDANLRGARLLKAILNRSNLQKAKLHRANLENADLSDANLREADLSNANLADASMSGADLYKATLNSATLRSTYLCRTHLHKATLRLATLRNSDFTSADLREADLRRADLSYANLREADLSRADLSGSTLDDADLYRCNLTRTQVLGASFEGAILTGICLENWDINKNTSFEGVECEYVYLEDGHTKRCPEEGIFAFEEFRSLVQKVVDTVSLIFKDGINWQAFFQSFQGLRNQYPDQDLSIQTIEKKWGGTFVIRVEVAEGADKSAIESSAQELYEAKLALMEQRYRDVLQAKEGEIITYKEQSANLMEIIKLQASRSINVAATAVADHSNRKTDLRSAQFAGGFAETVQGDQVGGTINNQSAETPSLAEAAAEIQALLNQLEASNPTATEADQTAFLNVMIPPTKRERFIGALRAASGAAIEEVPYGAVLKALVEGWQKPNG